MWKNPVVTQLNRYCIKIVQFAYNTIKIAGGKIVQFAYKHNIIKIVT